MSYVEGDHFYLENRTTSSGKVENRLAIYINVPAEFTEAQWIEIGQRASIAAVEKIKEIQAEKAFLN